MDPLTSLQRNEAIAVEFEDARFVSTYQKALLEMKGPNLKPERGLVNAGARLFHVLDGWGIGVGERRRVSEDFLREEWSKLTEEQRRRGREVHMTRIISACKDQGLVERFWKWMRVVFP